MKHYEPFVEKEPPLNPRLRRWFCFLSQFKLKFVHLPGLKNEWCDWLSRHVFDEKYGLYFERLVQDAFERMDTQLDLHLKVLSMEIQKFPFPLQYEKSEFASLWQKLEEWKTEVIEDSQWFKAKEKMFCERKLAIPHEIIPLLAQWLHRNHGHPAAEKTLWSFLKHFHSSLPRKDLLGLFKNVLGGCETCLLSKTSTQVDRGLLGSLSIPPLCNDVIYLDFVALDEFNSFDYALGIVDGLSRF